MQSSGMMIKGDIVKLYWIALFLTGALFLQLTNAASVTSWGGQQKQSLQSQIVGKWQLVAIYENDENITTDESLKNYWIFKRTGWVEHNEVPIGVRRSHFWVSGRTLAIRLKDNQGIQSFTISYLDRDKMIWRYHEGEKTYTYNLARYN